MWQKYMVSKITILKFKLLPIIIVYVVITIFFYKASCGSWPFFNYYLPEARFENNGLNINFNGERYYLDPRYEVRPPSFGKAIARINHEYIYEIKRLGKEWIAYQLPGTPASAYRHENMKPLDIEAFSPNKLGIGLASSWNFKVVIDDKDLIQIILKSLKKPARDLPSSKPLVTKQVYLTSEKYPGLLYSLLYYRYDNNAEFLYDYGKKEKYRTNLQGWSMFSQKEGGN